MEFVMVPKANDLASRLFGPHFLPCSFGERDLSEPVPAAEITQSFQRGASCLIYCNIWCITCRYRYSNQ